MTLLRPMKALVLYNALQRNHYYTTHRRSGLELLALCPFASAQLAHIYYLLIPHPGLSDQVDMGGGGILGHGRWKEKSNQRKKVIREAKNRISNPPSV